MALHPKGHVRERSGGNQVGSRLEVRLNIRTVVVADQQEGGYAATDDQDKCRRDTEEYVAEMSSLIYPIEIGEQDCDDHRRLDALAKKDDECRNHEMARVYLEQKAVAICKFEKAETYPAKSLGIFISVRLT
jgi:hypothetical protein